MAETLRIQDKPVAVEGPADQYTLRNLGPDTAYYGAANVSSSSNDGSIAAGSSVTVAPTKWLVSAGQSRVTVAAVAQGSSGSGSGGVLRPPPTGFAITRRNFNVYRHARGIFSTDYDMQADRPPAGTTYYAAPGGINGNSGLTPALPKSLTQALAMGDRGTIILADGEYLYGQGPTANIQTSVNLIASGSGAVVTGCADPASLTWVLDSGNIYRTTRSLAQNVYDKRTTQRTAWGGYPNYVKKADLASITGAGQWALVGSTLYVWALGNANLVTDSSFIRVSLDTPTGVLPYGPCTVYVEGVTFEGCGSASASRGSVNGYAAGATDGPVLLAKDCRARNSAAFGFGGSGARWSAFQNCEASDCFSDGFSYQAHTLSTTEVVAPQFLEVDCVGHHNGYNTATENNNAFTSHDSSRGVRLNGYGHDTFGPICVDVLAANTWNLGIVAENSTAVAADIAFQADSAGSKQWLEDCESRNCKYGVNGSNTGQIAMRGHRFVGNEQDVSLTGSGTVVRY